MAPAARPPVVLLWHMHQPQPISAGTPELGGVMRRASAG
jgi:hypothetical protein